MKILHTSDWHLGRSLYGRQRYAEFTAFLDWTIKSLTENDIDVLLVAGDIFDTTTPSNTAQRLYYQFLCQVATTTCRHVVIIAGNHDSPTFINAPKTLLQALNIHVVGAACEDPNDEVVVLSDEGGIPQLIVCAVPYLRDKDIRSITPGETIDDKNAKLLEGLKNHYALVCEQAKVHQSTFISQGHGLIPIIGMGHLFTSGGKTLDGDGVRELYVGTLAHVGSDIFPSYLSYVALGHLHVPQRVSGLDHIRYSGSPIAMGYGEASQQKIVLIIELSEQEIAITESPVPCFQALVKITGDIEEIETRIDTLKSQDSSAWLEIEYIGDKLIHNFNEHLSKLIEDSCIEIRRVRHKKIVDKALRPQLVEQTLDDLDVYDVFEKRLEGLDLETKDRDELTISYKELVTQINETDRQAE